VLLISQDSRGLYDPSLVAAFSAAAPRFDQIHLGQ